MGTNGGRRGRTRGMTRDDRLIDDRVARPGGSLTNAQVDRLCVLPARRGSGVKERLLRCADGFHAIGVPVRVKTASRSAAGSFVRCALLAYDGFKDPTRAGVSKRRGTKTVVVVDANDATSRTTRDDDPRRYEDDWRNREVGRSIPVAAETPKRDAEERRGNRRGAGPLRPLRPLRARGKSEATGGIGNPPEVEVGRSFGAIGIDARRRRARRSTASRRTPSSPSPTRSPPPSPPPSPTTRWETRFPTRGRKLGTRGRKVGPGGFVHRGPRRGEGREGRNVPRDVRGRRRARRRAASPLRRYAVARSTDRRPRAPPRRLRLRGRLRRVRAAGSMRRGEGAGRTSPGARRFSPSWRRGAWSRTI